MHLQALPSDGAVISVTPDTMMRLQNMVDFIQPLASVFASLEDSNWSARTSTDQLSTSSGGQKSVDGGSDANQLLSHYCLDTVEMLLQNLEAKGRMLLKQKNVLGVFLANNVAVVDRTIRTSELAPILTGSLSRLEAWRKKAVSLYLDSWKDPSAFLLDVQYTNRGGQRPASGSSTAVNSAEIVKALGNKEKDAIKDKFRGFNASFDELVARHRSLAMEREVRSQLAREVQAMIEPLYGRFWDRYHEIDKGKGKYVKFDKGQLAAVLAALG
jgi:exocyst complex protein 7